MFARGFTTRGARGTGVLPLTITKTGDAKSGSASTSYSFPLPFGVAEFGRVLGAAISMVAQFSLPSFTGVTIGGVSATSLVQQTHTPANALTRTGIFGAVVPGGTSGNVVVNASPAPLRMDIGLFAIHGGASLTPRDVLGSNAANPSGTLDIAAGGVAFAHIGITSGASSTNWTGLTEQYDAHTVSVTYYSGASDAFSVAEAARLITAAPNGAAYSRAMAAVSLQAA